MNPATTNDNTTPRSFLSTQILSLLLPRRGSAPRIQLPRLFKNRAKTPPPRAEHPRTERFARLAPYKPGSPRSPTNATITDAQKVVVELTPGNGSKDLKLNISASTQVYPLNGAALVNGKSLVSPQTGRPHAYDGNVARYMLAMGQSVALHSPTSATVFATLVLLLVGVIDYVTGPQLSFGVFYMVPVSFAGWFAGRKTGTVLGVLAGLIWLAADLASGTHLHWPAAIWNITARVAVFIFVVLILAHIRALHLDLEDTVADRTQQLEAETSRRLNMEREIAAVSHREQQRIAHELHDGLGQELGALAFQAKLLSSKLNQSGSALAKEAQSLVQVLNRATGRTRALSHLLDPLGESTGALRHALSVLADESGQAFAIACTFDAPHHLPALSPGSELNLYRIAQEAIHNAVEHGHASEITIRAGVTKQELQMHISDNGRGFVPNGSTRDSGGMGVRIMRYRADALGARLQLSSAPGKGCAISCSVPIPECTAS